MHLSNLPEDLERVSWGQAAAGAEFMHKFPPFVKPRTNSKYVYKIIIVLKEQFHLMCVLQKEQIFRQ